MSGSGDYISREAAKKQMRNGRHTAEWLLASGAKTIGDSFEIILDEVLAADVRPVVRGKWIEKDSKPIFPGMDEHPILGCSKCDFKIYDILGTVRAKYHFCPNCGADMREES